MSIVAYYIIQDEQWINIRHTCGEQSSNMMHIFPYSSSNLASSGHLLTATQYTCIWSIVRLPVKIWKTHSYSDKWSWNASIMLMFTNYMSVHVPVLCCWEPSN